MSKLEELRKKREQKSFYQLNANDKNQYIKDNLFNYDDSNVPYKCRKGVLDNLRRETF